MRRKDQIEYNQRSIRWWKETLMEKMQESMGQNAPPAQSALFSNLGGSTLSRRNNMLYMRPDRDYTKHLTWTYEMNKNLHDIYNEAKQEGRGYM